MADIGMKELLEAGVHFGHQTRRWNPKMKKFIFIERNGIYILDLQKTLKALQEARALLDGVARKNGTVLFVGTKRQAKDAIKEEADRCGMPYVNERWLGGMLTNFKTIKSNILILSRGGFIVERIGYVLLIGHISPVVLGCLTQVTINR